MLSKVCRGRYFFVFSSFWWLLAVLGIPWFVDTSVQFPLPSSYGLLSRISVSLSANCFLLIRTPVIFDLGPLIQYDFTLA